MTDTIGDIFDINNYNQETDVFVLIHGINYDGKRALHFESYNRRGMGWIKVWIFIGNEDDSEHPENSFWNNVMQLIHTKRPALLVVAKNNMWQVVEEHKLSTEEEVLPLLTALRLRNV